MTGHLNQRHCNDENHEQTEPKSKWKSRRSGPKLVCKTCKSYGDMRGYHVKVTYNTMGEPIKNKIKIDCKVPRKHSKQRNRYRCEDSSLSRIQSQFEAKTLIVKRKETTYSFLDLKRTIHVLREVLLGKLSRDIMYSRVQDDCPLPEMLRFYCQTSFGATSVADCRQTDLFNAILALQSTSPFIRTMKRLLHIPGIQPFSKQISDIYFEMWSWFLKNDVFAHGECEFKQQDVISTDVDTKLKILLISEDKFFQCFDDIELEHGNLFSPYFRMDLKQKIKALNKYEVSLDQQQINKHWLDTDEAIEASLQMMEEVDGRISEVKNHLFGHKVPRNKILTPKCRETLSARDDDTPKGVRKKDSLDSLLHELNVILDKCIMLDPNRLGWIQYIHFKQIAEDWCNSAAPFSQLEHSQFKTLFEHFQTDDDAVAAADYINFVSVLYAILLDEHSIPNIDAVLAYFCEPRRRVESQHYALFEEYVRTLCLKKSVTSTDQLQEHVLHDIAVESRRNMSKLGSTPTNSDFISKWLTTGSMRCEYQHDLEESLNKAKMRHVSTPTKSTKNCNRPKAPLHLVELQGSFDPKMDTTSNTCDYKDEDEGDDNDNYLSQIPFHPDLKTTNIYVRFPDIAPRKSICFARAQTPLNDGERHMSAENNPTQNEKVFLNKDDCIIDNTETDLLYDDHEQAVNTPEKAINCGPRCKEDLPLPYPFIYNRKAYHSSSSNSLEETIFAIKMTQHKPKYYGELKKANEDRKNLPSIQQQQLYFRQDDSKGSSGASSSNKPLTMDTITEDSFNEHAVISSLTGSHATVRDHFLNESPITPSTTSSLRDEECLSEELLVSSISNKANVAEITALSKKGALVSSHHSDRDIHFHDESNINGNTEPYGSHVELNLIEEGYEDFTQKENGKNQVTETAFVIGNDAGISIHRIEVGTLMNLDYILHMRIIRPNILPLTAFAVATSSFYRLIDLSKFSLSNNGPISPLRLMERYIRQLFSGLLEKNCANQILVVKIKNILMATARRPQQMMPTNKENNSQPETKYQVVHKNDNINNIINSTSNTNCSTSDSMIISNINSLCKYDGIDQRQNELIAFPAFLQNTKNENGFSYEITQNHLLTTLSTKNEKEHTKFSCSNSDQSMDLDFTKLHLTGRWQWEDLFKHNESVMLGIISKFQRLHEDLHLSRNRHKPNKMEMENYVTYFSILNRVSQLVKLKTKGEEKKYGDEGILIYNRDLNLGVGIKSLLLTAQTRKRIPNHHAIVDQKQVTSLSNASIRKQKIQVISYRIAK